MPHAPLKPCTVPLCPELTTGGKCERHRKQARKQSDARRPNFRQRGYTSNWDAYAKAYKRANPLCRTCLEQGTATPTYCVDHIKPVTGPDDPLFWDQTNHQPLCLTCHSVKTATEDGGFGNTKRIK